jgi:glyoxylase-like metal-dependent hydrolase (beta-lactamase superfamily II)
MPHGLVLPLAFAVAVHAFTASGDAGAARVPAGWRRRLLVAGSGVVAALVAVALIVLPYRPIVVAGAAAPRGPFTLPRPVPGLRLHVFNTGMNRMSALLVGAERPWRPAPAFVIEHPTHGLVVFDGGLSEAVARDGEAALPVPLRWLFESRGRPGRTLDAQMRESGFDPGRVPLVVVSHLHDDHTGALPAFRAAQFIGGAGTRAHFADLASRWREIGPAEATLPLPPFAGALDLFGDGSIAIVPGGGHAREDLMLLLALPEGPVLLAGDAVVHRDWLAGDDVQRIAVDGARAAAVRNEVRALVAAEPRLVLFPGHDLGTAPRDRADVVLHHAEWFGADAWPVSP